jgi:hypothetical protein
MLRYPVARGRETAAFEAREVVGTVSGVVIARPVDAERIDDATTTSSRFDEERCPSGRRQVPAYEQTAKVHGA